MNLKEAEDAEKLASRIADAAKRVKELYASAGHLDRLSDNIERTNRVCVLIGQSGGDAIATFSDRVDRIVESSARLLSGIAFENYAPVDSLVGIREAIAKTAVEFIRQKANDMRLAAAEIKVPTA